MGEQRCSLFFEHNMEVSSYALRLSQGFGGFVSPRRGGAKQRKETGAMAGLDLVGS